MLTIVIIITIASLLLNLYLKYSNDKLNSQLTNSNIKVHTMNQYIDWLSKELERKNRENDLLH